MRVCECALRSQDLRKTAYVVEGDGLLPLLGRLQRELGVWPRGSGTSPSEQPRLQKFFKKHLASEGRCVATVAVSVSDRWLNDGWSCDGL